MFDDMVAGSNHARLTSYVAGRPYDDDRVSGYRLSAIALVDASGVDTSSVKTYRLSLAQCPHRQHSDMVLLRREDTQPEGSIKGSKIGT